ncbi:MAG: UDP-N-acetylglucosamine 1-carboxyvinyltransferase [Peptococcaceae bacterium]|nr:UDP-N-acetylglucosamine 1-carboxyvinyltransferase [Peptococcaceae bacterium]
MDRVFIAGGCPLRGRVRVSGSKNATLPIMAACLLTSGVSTLREVPRIKDVLVMQDVLEVLGARLEWRENDLVVDTSPVGSSTVPEDLMRSMRASNLVLGALLGRFGQATISYPGGCNIGSRPMDLHMKGCRALGVRFFERFGLIKAHAPVLSGAEIHLDQPSVGATENIMMAAVSAKGTTVIRNAAKEPEIVDLQNFLAKMGARIQGAGTDTVRIEGVTALYPADHAVIPDRIESGTHMLAAAITGGDVLVENVIPEHAAALIAKLREAGLVIEVADSSVRVAGNGRLAPVSIKTLPYPGFPTDLQPQMTALLCRAQGTSVITETVFENRMKHVGELRRLGAHIKVEGQSAIVRGPAQLSGAIVEASDLRAGAALVLAGLASENGTVVENAEHLDRGYERLEEKYRQLGARISRSIER